MARMYGVATTTEIALTAATAKTVVQLATSANHRIAVLGWGVFFDAVSVTAEPVQVRLLIQTGAGTMSSLTPAPVHAMSETLQTTCQHTATVEPTNGGTSACVLDVLEVHPQSGYEIKFPPGHEIEIGASSYIGIECTAPAAVNVRAKIFFEE